MNGQARAAAAELTVVVLDQSRPLDDDARAMLARHPDAIRVANKADAAAAWADPDGPANRRHDRRRRGGRADRGPTAGSGASRWTLNRPRWWTDRQRNRLAIR